MSGDLVGWESHRAAWAHWNADGPHQVEAETAFRYGYMYGLVAGTKPDPDREGSEERDRAAYKSYRLSWDRWVRTYGDPALSGRGGDESVFAAGFRDGQLAGRLAERDGQVTA